MQRETETLVGRVQNVTFENEESGFAVLELLTENGELMVAVGPLCGSVPGEELTLCGMYTTHPSYGTQFQAESCTFLLPENDNDILQYLSSGVLPGIGPAVARHIVARFGADSLQVLAQEPEKLAEVKGFSLKKAQKAAQVFTERYGAREVILSLMQLGLDMSVSTALYRHYKQDAVELIVENPYRMCEYPAFLSFSYADGIALFLGMEKDCDERIQASILTVMRHNLQNGHSCLPAEKLMNKVASHFDLSLDLVKEALLTLRDSGKVVLLQGEKERVFLPDYYHAEMNAAHMLQKKIYTSSPVMENLEAHIQALEKRNNIIYDVQQKEAIRLAMQCGTLVITGGPGTGKTTAINAILSLFEQQAERVFLAAPTGRAAKRMSELTQRKASTIHRMLEVDFRAGMETPSFKHNAKNPLRCDVLVVDELSMVDALLFESLLSAVPSACRLILVGDIDQLPSVNAGDVMRGILQSGKVPYVKLEKIFRQAQTSLIVQNAHAIVRGEPLQKSTMNDDFFYIRKSGKEAQDLVCELVKTRLPEKYGVSPIAEIQVLCPGHKGVLGTRALCEALQAQLNPKEEGRAEIASQDFVLREGDKVMQVKNNYDISWTRLDGENGQGAFNGDIGIVESIDKRAGVVVVLCEDRRVYYEQENLHELVPAYAITIHKSQGSEFEVVVLVISNSPEKLQFRNLLYTAVTRAKSLCVLVGEDKVLGQMLKNDDKNSRFSSFADFLKEDGAYVE